MRHRILLSIFVILLAANTYGQNHEYTYTYDAAGNRTGRMMVKSAFFPSDLLKDLESKLPLTDEEITEPKIIVYPNPTDGHIVIEVTCWPENVALRMLIIDTSGRILVKKSDCSSTESFDISAQPNGIYFLRVDGGNFSHSWKIMKE